MQSGEPALDGIKSLGYGSLTNQAADDATCDTTDHSTHTRHHRAKSRASRSTSPGASCSASNACRLAHRINTYFITVGLIGAADFKCADHDTHRPGNLANRLGQFASTGQFGSFIQCGCPLRVQLMATCLGGRGVGAMLCKGCSILVDLHAYVGTIGRGRQGVAPELGFDTNFFRESGMSHVFGSQDIHLSRAKGSVHHNVPLHVIASGSVPICQGILGHKAVVIVNLIRRDAHPGRLSGVNNSSCRSLPGQPAIVGNTMSVQIITQVDASAAPISDWRVCKIPSLLVVGRILLKYLCSLGMQSFSKLRMFYPALNEDVALTCDALARAPDNATNGYGIVRLAVLLG